MQGTLGVLGIITLYFICVFLPETSHFSAEGGKTELKNTKVVRNFMSVNPLRPLWLLRSPPFFMIVRLFSKNWACLELSHSFRGLYYLSALSAYSVSISLCDVLFSVYFGLITQVFSANNTTHFYYCMVFLQKFVDCL